MKQYEYRLTHYVGMLEQRNPNLTITPELFALQKWHPCYMDYLQADGHMTKREAPEIPDQDEDDPTIYIFDPKRPRYTEADEQSDRRRQPTIGR